MFEYLFLRFTIILLYSVRLRLTIDFDIPQITGDAQDETMGGETVYSDIA